jgi:beta-glucanase (GH16 family)
LVWFTNYFEREPVSENYKKGYHVTFEDNFDKPIDWVNKWNKYYSINTETPNDMILHSDRQIKVENGKCLLTTDKSNIDPKKFPYETGYLCSKDVFSQELGIFKYRVKAPRGGLEFFAAAWAYEEGLDGRDLKNKPPLEIDAGEYMHKGDFGGKTTSFSVHHHFHKLPNGRTMKGKNFRFLNLSKYYHIVSFDWQEDKITWSLNNIPIYRVVNHIPRVKMCLVINNAAHKSRWPLKKDLPGVFKVDSVIVFQKNNNK